MSCSFVSPPVPSNSHPMLSCVVPVHATLGRRRKKSWGALRYRRLCTRLASFIQRWDTKRKTGCVVERARLAPVPYTASEPSSDSKLQMVMSTSILTSSRPCSSSSTTCPLVGHNTTSSVCAGCKACRQHVLTYCYSIVIHIGCSQGLQQTSEKGSARERDLALGTHRFHFFSVWCRLGTLQAQNPPYGQPGCRRDLQLLPPHHICRRPSCSLTSTSL